MMRVSREMPTTNKPVFLGFPIELEFGKPENLETNPQSKDKNQQ